MDLSRPPPLTYDRCPEVCVVLSAAVRAGLLHEDDPAALFFDLDYLDERSAALHVAFASSNHGGGRLHCVAVKACPLRGILVAAAALGLGAECASFVELNHALSCGFAPSTIMFDSPSKTLRELRFCIDRGIAMNCDSLGEVERVAAVVDEALASPTPPLVDLATLRVGLRVNPAVGVGTIASSSTATLTSKFGVAIDDPAVLAAYEAHSWLNGLHSHVGSQSMAMVQLVEGVRATAALASEIIARGSTLKFVDIGGGLRVNYDGPTDAPTFAAYAEALRESGVWSTLDRSGLTIVTEFGRALVAKMGWTASLVESTKCAGGRRIATVHLGADCFVRTCYLPAQWALHVTVHTAGGAPKSAGDGDEDDGREEWDIAGPLCFSGDLIAVKRLLPPLTRGDLVVIHDTGGYCLSMWSRYNSRRSPACYTYRRSAVGGANSAESLRCIRERETVEQVAAFWG